MLSGKATLKIILTSWDETFFFKNRPLLRRGLVCRRTNRKSQMIENIPCVSSPGMHAAPF